MSPAAEEPLEGVGYGGRGSVPKGRPSTKQDTGGSYSHRGGTPRCDLGIFRWRVQGSKRLEDSVAASMDWQVTDCLT